MNKEKEQELRDQYKDRGELTVNFILFAYDHYGELLDFSDTYVEDQNKETVVDIVGYCRAKIIPKLFMTPLLNKWIIERTIDFVDNLKKVKPHVSIIPKKTIYKNAKTLIIVYCIKHKKEFSGLPTDLLNEKKLICKDCRIESVRRIRRTTTLQSYQAKLDNKFGKDKFTILIEETINKLDMDTKKTLKDKIEFCYVRCNACGTVFNYTNIRDINRTIENPCPHCKINEKNERSLEIFLNKFNTINKEEAKYLDFDFSQAFFRSVRLKNGRSTGKIFNIKCNRCGKYFDMKCSSLLRMVRCPHCSKSSGELVIEQWLIEKNISFSCQVNLLNEDIISMGHPRGFYIDFVISSEIKTYWIEYNGEQHYTYCTHINKSIDDFYKQLQRDEYIKNYCEKNNIELIELPWTLNSKNVVNILEDILINNTPHPYEFPNIKLVRKKEFPDTGLYRGEFLKQNGLL
jgi:hypothetical protein